MKTSKKIFSIAAALGFIALVGCSTPDTRIRSDPQSFAQLTPEQQAMVKAGQISVGMGMEAVRLALGAPDHVTLHTTSAGQTQVWHYVDYDYADYGPYWGPWGGGGPGWGGRWGGRHWARGGWGPGWGWGAYPVGAYDRFRVTFDRNSLVSSIQQEMK